MGILLLGAWLTIHPVLPLLTPDAYGAASDLVAVILLGFFVFGLNFMFEVPALLSKKTHLLVPGSIAGLTVNGLANIALFPHIGTWGRSSLTQPIPGTVLFCCRRVMKVPYPWGEQY